jgi:hypothetical protein
MKANEKDKTNGEEKSKPGVASVFVNLQQNFRL